MISIHSFGWTKHQNQNPQTKQSIRFFCSRLRSQQLSQKRDSVAAAKPSCAAVQLQFLRKLHFCRVVTCLRFAKKQTFDTSTKVECREPVKRTWREFRSEKACKKCRTVEMLTSTSRGDGWVHSIQGLQAANLEPKRKLSVKCLCRVGCHRCRVGCHSHRDDFNFT